MQNPYPDDIMFSVNLEKNSTHGPTIVGSFFSAFFNYSCPLNSSIGTTFDNPTLNSTATFENGTIISWAVIDVANGFITFVDVPINLDFTYAKVGVHAYNADGLNTTGYVAINIANFPPYNTTSFTDYTMVAGDAVQTYNVSGTFSDHEGEDITLSSDTSNSDCVEFSNDIFTINPSNWSTNCKNSNITLVATDESASSSNVSFIIDVTNQPPQILSSPSALTVYDNISFSHSVNYSDHFQENDITHSLQYSVSGVPSFMNYSLVGDLITFQGNSSIADINQNYTIQLVANDSFEQSSIDLIVEVLENEPPTPSSSTYPLSLLEGQQGMVTIPFFTDSEGDPITYS